MTVQKSKGIRKDGRKTKVSKPILRSKLKLRSKHTKAQIQKLDKDIQHITEIHSELAGNTQGRKEVKTLDAGILRAELQRDEKVQNENKKAEEDIQSQLEFITGMSLDKI